MEHFLKAALILLGVACIAAFVAKARKCEESGGVIVNAVPGPVCVDRTVLKN